MNPGSGNDSATFNLMKLWNQQMEHRLNVHANHIQNYDSSGLRRSSMALLNPHFLCLMTDANLRVVKSQYADPQHKKL